MQMRFAVSVETEKMFIFIYVMNIDSPIKQQNALDDQILILLYASSISTFIYMYQWRP